jgi:FkbO/Hyg5 family chorismatase
VPASVTSTVLPTASEELSCVLSERIEHVLGIVEFGSGTADRRQLSRAVPSLHVALPSSHGTSVTEVWLSSHRTSVSTVGRFKVATDGHHLFGGTSSEDTLAPDVIAEAIYDEFFETIRELDYEHPIRIWNYIPRINAPTEAGLERYKAFNIGRASSFQNNCRETRDSAVFPAGTGIGSFGGGITQYFLSTARKQHVHIENPQQIPAYRYPAEYGPRSPSFARATYLDGGDRFGLYVAGTASILGSESTNSGQIAAQLETTFRNIEVLVSGVNLQRHGVPGHLDLSDMEAIKAYVRHPRDFEIVRQACQLRFSPGSEITVLHADICRAELDVEIEGIIRKPKGR